MGIRDGMGMRGRVGKRVRVGKREGVVMRRESWGGKEGRNRGGVGWRRGKRWGMGQTKIVA